MVNEDAGRADVPPGELRAMAPFELPTRWCRGGQAAGSPCGLWGTRGYVRTRCGLLLPLLRVDTTLADQRRTRACDFV